MAVTTAGVSTLGVKVGYAVGDTTCPSAFTCLERCNSVGGISLDTEKIDASALEDSVSKYIAGRADTGGDWSMTFNLTNETYTQLAAMIAAYKKTFTTGDSDYGKVMWFEVYSPYLSNAFYVIAQPPLQIPVPEFSQNELQTVELTLAIVEYKGMLTAVEPTIS